MAEVSDKILLGYAISDLRRSRGLKQVDLARKLGVSKSTVGMWEQGNREPNLETIKKLAQAMEVDVSYFWAMIDRPDPEGTEIDFRGKTTIAISEPEKGKFIGTVTEDRLELISYIMRSSDERINYIENLFDAAQSVKELYDPLWAKYRKNEKH